MTRVRYTSFLVVVLPALMVGGCIDPLSFESQKAQGQLVVSGKIHDGPGPYYLALGMTTTENTLPLPEAGASITLFNDRGEQEDYVETENEGHYMVPGNIINGTRGDTYHIEIELRDGRTFSSLPETMPMHSGKDALILEPTRYEYRTPLGTVVDAEGIYIYSDTHIPEHNEPLFLKWDLESLYLFREMEPLSSLGPAAKTCFVTESINPQHISLYSTRDSPIDTIERHFLGIKDVIPDQFYIRHYVNVIVSSVTERRYTYWQKVDQVINQTGTVFDVAPATAPGNIRDERGDVTEAFGYFEAAAMDTSRALIMKFDLETYIQNPCPTVFGPIRRSVCGNCLELENSTLERPPYLQ